MRYIGPGRTGRAGIRGADRACCAKDKTGSDRNSEGNIIMNRFTGVIRKTKLTAAAFAAALALCIVLPEGGIFGLNGLTVCADELNVTSDSEEVSDEIGEAGDESSAEDAEGAQESTGAAAGQEKKTYETYYITDETGEGAWYLYNNEEGTRFKISEIDHIVSESEEIADQNESIQIRYQVIIMVMGIIIIALLAVITFLVLRSRNEEQRFEEEYEERRRAGDNPPRSRDNGGRTEGAPRRRTEGAAQNSRTEGTPRTRANNEDVSSRRVREYVDDEQADGYEGTASSGNAGAEQSASRSREPRYRQGE